MCPRSLLLITFMVLAVAVGACAPMPPESRVFFSADYWERSDPTSALYLRGTEAQQRLNRDIARCVIEIRDLEDIAPLRESIPADSPVDPREAHGRLEQWDTPDREGELYYEHLDYHDFETCMNASGWKRASFVPFDVGRKARSVYIETITGEKLEEQ